MANVSGNSTSNFDMKVQDMVLLHNHLVTYLQKAMPQAKGLVKDYPDEDSAPDEIKEFLYTVASLTKVLKALSGKLSDDHDL